MSKERISAIVLAGGRGQRMQNRDKGLLQWRGRSLAQHCIARIQPQVDDIVLSCNRNLDSYKRFGFTVVQDQVANYQGPLAGIHAALPACKAELVFVCPCDCPLLPGDVVVKLWQALNAEKADIAIAHDGKRAQSLVMLMRRSCASELEDHLQSGARSVQSWQQRQHYCYVDFSSQRGAFTNFNHTAELNG